MSLQELHDGFFSGALDMATYAAAMQPLHRQLLDYANLLPATDVARIEIADGQVVLTCRSTGLKLCYEDPLDRYAVLSLLNFGKYEAADTTALLRFAEGLAGAEPFTFLDIGANMGWYALSLAQRFPAATVHAFEPVPATFRILERNLALNGFANVTLHNQGLADRPGTQTIYCDPRISGRASGRNLVEDPAALPVPCAFTRLDDFVQAHGVRPDLVKVDVEGAELLVFRGGLETLAAHRPLILAEMLRKWARKFGYHPDEIIALLAGLGYVCTFMEDRRMLELAAMTEAVNAKNFFFLHRDRHAALLAGQGR